MRFPKQLSAASISSRSSWKVQAWRKIKGVRIVLHNGEEYEKGRPKEAFYIEMVKKSGWKLGNIPEALRTEAVCLEAVKSYGPALEQVPAASMTELVCLEAVKKGFSRRSGMYDVALKYVPEALRTEAVCIAAFKQDTAARGDMISTLDYVPDSLKAKVKAALKKA